MVPVGGFYFGFVDKEWAVPLFLLCAFVRERERENVMCVFVFCFCLKRD